jgi:ABC-type nickel/cobalt efflux system permease component RcnA
LLWFGIERDWRRVQPVAALLVASAALMLLIFFAHRDDVMLGSVTAYLFGASVLLIGLLGAFMYWRQRELVLSKR